MEAASPWCRRLFGAGLLALAGCQSDGSSGISSARGQAPPELAAPLSPASMPPALPPQPLPPMGTSSPVQPIAPGATPASIAQPSQNAAVQGLPINAAVAWAPVQGSPINSAFASPPVQGLPVAGPANVPGAPIQGLPVASANAGMPVQGFPISSGPVAPSGTVTPASLVIPAPDRMNVPSIANTPREAMPAVPLTGSPQVKVMALVGTSPITDQEVMEAIRQRITDYKDLPAPARVLKEKELYKEELRKIIERELIIEDMFSRMKKNKQSPEEIKESVALAAEQTLRTIRNQQGARTEEEFIVMLRSQGITIPVLRRQIERNIMMDEYVRGLLKEAGRTPGFAEIRGYYDTHPDQFKTEDRVRWQGIFVGFNSQPSPQAAYSQAEKLRQLALEGTDFVSLVKSQEKNPHGRQSWDGIGTTRQTVPVDLSATIWSLQPGQISGIVESPGGYHIVKVVEREYAGVRPFDTKVQNECRDKLKQQYRQVEYKRLIEDLWRKGTVEVFETL